MLRIQETSKSCHRDLLSTKRVKQGDSSNLDYLASYVYSIKISWLLITQNLLFIFFSSTKDELSRHISSLNVNNTAMKLRKAALKARHQKELNDLRTRMQKEIDLICFSASGAKVLKNRVCVLSNSIALKRYTEYF